MCMLMGVPQYRGRQRRIAGLNETTDLQWINKQNTAELFAVPLRRIGESRPCAAPPPRQGQGAMGVVRRRNEQFSEMDATQYVNK